MAAEQSADRLRADRRGKIALVGSGEFLPGMDPVDQALLAGIAGQPVVAIVPTASAPDGDAVFNRWLRQGVEHFGRLGATAVPIPLKTRADAERADFAAEIARSTFVYLSGGKPSYLRDTLASTPCWEAIAGVFARGGVVAGCSAGAMILGAATFDFRQPTLHRPALGLAPGVIVIPHFDEVPRLFGGLLDRLTDLIIPDGTTLVGVDGYTALVYEPDSAFAATPNPWRVSGRGGVTVFAGRHRVAYTDGQVVPLAAS